MRPLFARWLVGLTVAAFAMGLALADAARAQAVAGARPQTPQPPFPYGVEEVAFESAPGVRLAGSLTLPPGRGPFPAAVMITGSGQQDRDETIYGHKPFAVIADALTRRGVAVLRLDDRGIGGSSGDFQKATVADFIGDARAAVAFLRARKDIDPRRVGLIGHSEGGIIGPMAAAQDPTIAFVVMLEGPGAPMRAVVKAQREAINLAMGASAETIATSDRISEDAIEAALSARDATDADAKVRAALLKDAPSLPPEALDRMVAPLTGEGLRDLLRADSVPALRTLRMPVLATVGSKDLQVTADLNLPALRQALKDDPKATVIELPGLNHLLQTATTGAPSEYAQIQETIAPAALKTIVDWVVAQTRR